MISEIRRIIGQNKFVKKVFNKLGGVDYAIYDRTNVISGTKYINHFVTHDGAKYKVDGYSNVMVEETRLEYDWSDIQPTDIVLDIGANIGGFTIGAALIAKHVYAVEPIFYKELEVNIELNNLKNVTVLPIAIGTDNTTLNLSFNKVERKNIPVRSFKGIKLLIKDKVDFLKCDCEGYEWYIEPTDLDGIRRIEIEIHPEMGLTETGNTKLLPYIKSNWNVVIDDVNGEEYIIHAKK